MNASNRAMNRLLLMLVGIVTIGAGAWIVLRTYPDLLPIALPELSVQPDAVSTSIVVAAAVAAIVLGLVWMFTRGGGRTRQLLRDSSANGAVEFDVAVANDVLSAALQRQPDILSLHVSAYTVRKKAALRITVTARSGCDLPRLRDDVARAVEQFDRAVERKIPVLLQVTSGVRTSFVREQRVT